LNPGGSGNPLFILPISSLRFGPRIIERSCDQVFKHLLFRDTQQTVINIHADDPPLGGRAHLDQAAP
jgi:hypothetical protein